MTNIKKQITKAMSNSELSHFWHIESQTLISFSDADEAADEYNDQIEAAPEDYLQISADSNMSEQALAEKFMVEKMPASFNDWRGKTATEMIQKDANILEDWTVYREQFYGKLAENWLAENGLVG